jgi:hypothetical protein
VLDHVFTPATRVAALSIVPDALPAYRQMVSRSKVRPEYRARAK